MRLGQRRGIEHIQNEISVYNKALKDHRNLFEDVVPCVFAMVKEPPEDTMLLTEFFGSELKLTFIVRWPRRASYGSEDDPYLTVCERNSLQFAASRRQQFPFTICQVYVIAQ